MASQLFGLARIGRDFELRSTSDGQMVGNLSLAFSYGRKGADGKRPTQWVEAALWGKLAEALAEYLTKGTAVMVTVDDVHIENFNRQDGTQGTKLAGRISTIELAGVSASARPPAPPPAPRPAPRPGPTDTGFDQMDEDIPFVTSSMACDLTMPTERRMRRYRYA